MVENVMADVVAYGRYADAVTMYKQRNQVMRRAMFYIEEALMATQNGSFGVAIEKMRMAYDMLDAGRRDGCDTMEVR